MSSIWSGIRNPLPRLIDDSRWTVGVDSKVKFWTDKWLVIVLVDYMGIPIFVSKNLNHLISDYYYDNCWHFHVIFFL